MKSYVSFNSGMRIVNKYISYIQNTVTFIGLALCAVLILISGPPSISDLYSCVVQSNLCNHESISKLFYIFAILFAGATFPVLLILMSFVHKNWQISEKINQDHDILKSMAKRAVTVITKNEFEDFYNSAIDEIERAPYNTLIRATSSFTPPDEDMRDKYFSRLADIINRENSFKYQVIIAKGDSDNDQLIKEAEKEIKTRIKYLDEVKGNGGKKRNWSYGSDFTIRQSRYHARMDFLIVGNSIFINANTSAKTTGDRGYIYIKDRKCAEVFTLWFDAIWNSHSNKVDYDKNTKVVTFYNSTEKEIRYRFRID